MFRNRMSCKGSEQPGRRRLRLSAQVVAAFALLVAPLALTPPMPALAIVGCSSGGAIAPTRYGNSLSGVSYLSGCPANSYLTVVSFLQQYRGLGYWASKAATFKDEQGTSLYSTATWACASGTGTQTYRTSADLSGPGGRTTPVSSNRVFTCP